MGQYCSWLCGRHGTEGTSFIPTHVAPNQHAPSLSGAAENCHKELSKEDSRIRKLKSDIDSLWAKELHIHHKAELMAEVQQAATTISEGGDVDEVRMKSLRKLAVIRESMDDCILVKADARGQNPELHLERQREFHEEFCQNTVKPMLDRLADAEEVVVVLSEAKRMMSEYQEKYEPFAVEKERETMQMYESGDAILALQKEEISLARPLIKEARSRPDSERLHYAALQPILTTMKLQEQGVSVPVPSMGLGSQSVPVSLSSKPDDASVIPASWIAFVLESMKLFTKSERVQKDGCYVLSLSISCGLPLAPDGMERVVEAMENYPANLAIQSYGKQAKRAMARLAGTSPDCTLTPVEDAAQAQTFMSLRSLGSGGQGLPPKPEL